VIRPAARAALLRWREAGAAAATIALGLWLFALGGYLLQGLGLLVAGTGAGWGLIALRRMRFLRAVTAPGLVEVDEGQISYFGAGPALGGQVALRELTEIRLLHLRDQHYWRLKQADGQAILIPVAAAGAAALHDAFATLPGIDMRRLSAALDQRVSVQSLWRRPAHLPLT
jgi:hypothetical protein